MTLRYNLNQIACLILGGVLSNLLVPAMTQAAALESYFREESSLLGRVGSRLRHAYPAAPRRFHA